MAVERQGNLGSDETVLYIVVAIQLIVFVKTHRTVLYKRGGHYGNCTFKKKKKSLCHLRQFQTLEGFLDLWRQQSLVSCPG